MAKKEKEVVVEVEIIEINEEKKPEVKIPTIPLSKVKHIKNAGEPETEVPYIK